ncbi:MAG TPA: RluA family pseudouridine synthase [Kofleriaceae bacterium]|nr:RluA family pseudouridine synthase [Kofleriaceae bacterium]
MITFVVDADEAGRADRVLARRFPGASRRRLAALFDEGAVKVGARVAKKGDRLDAGDEVTLTAEPAEGEDLRPVADEKAAAILREIYLDDDVVIVAKPAGMPSQPLRAGETGTAANGLAVLHPECTNASDDPRDGGLVHRLDIGTSGALAAARNRHAWVRLRRAFSIGAVEKEYLALTFGAPIATECMAPLAQRGKKVAIDHAEGLPAYTAFEIVQKLGDWRLVKCRASTGRMHQIRAHLAHCGAPIAGDVLYGGPALAGLDGFFLHAARLVLPREGDAPPIDVEAPLPPDRRAVIASLTG